MVERHVEGKFESRDLFGWRVATGRKYVDAGQVLVVEQKIVVAVDRQTADMVKLAPEDIADAVLYIVTRDRRVAVNHMLVRAAEQTW